MVNPNRSIYGSAMGMRRHHALVWAAAGLAAVWLVALVAFGWFRGARITPERAAAFLHQTQLEALTGAERRQALDEMARLLNGLSLEDRRKARMDQAWRLWFDSMTDEEKERFLEATMPTGLKQMLASFEELPEERRQQAVEQALRNLQRTRQSMDDEADQRGPWGRRDESAGELNPELQKKMIGLGLSTFYSESSAQTKAELAPVLEEMQRQMERGRLFRGPRP